MDLIGQHRVSMSLRDIVKLLTKEVSAASGTQKKADAKPEGFVSSVQQFRDLFE
jgi:hypothetical protein